MDDDEKKSGTRVFKKTSPNGKITTYLGKRDFLDRGDSVDLIDGMVLIDDEYIKASKKVSVQLLAAFRYGREDLDVLGLTFRKDLISQNFQIFPPNPLPNNRPMTRLQERLKKKLGNNAFPFWFEIPPNSASSVTLQPAQGDTGKPCGVDYEVKTIVVILPQPMIDVTKEFIISPGGLHLEASLDKEMYYHGESINVNVHVQNNSNKTVKKIKVSVNQIADICIFTTAQYTCDVDKIESCEGFPHSVRENLGIIVQYKVKIRLLIAGALGGELAAELPFTLTHPKPSIENENNLLRTITSPRQLNDNNGSGGGLEQLKSGGEGQQNNIDNTDQTTTADVDLIQFDSFDDDDDLVFEDFARNRARGTELMAQNEND
uniref:Arrestin C-terminal-like domain-containing protein n=1 Tax=Meloidogyne javanica TaxID=6303 RepID=A0A915MQV2_MELJA